MLARTLIIALTLLQTSLSYGQHMKINHTNGGFSLVNLVNTRTAAANSDTLIFLKDSGQEYKFAKDQIDYCKFYANTLTEIINPTVAIENIHLYYLKVFLNPASNEISLMIETNEGGKMIVELVSATGSVHRLLETNVNGGLVEYSVDVAGFATGAYFFTITVGNIFVNEPIVITN